MRVNYLIASSAHRHRPATSLEVEGSDILRLHLEELSKTNTEDLAQITLLRIYNPAPIYTIDNQLHPYWEVSEQIKKMKCPVEVLDLPNECISYGAWVRAVQKYQQDFDYYIIIEDDYYPTLPNFVPTLIDLHAKLLPNGGYLNSLTAGRDDTGFAAISNGIIDSQTFTKAINRVKNPIKVIAKEPQTQFSFLFAPYIADYLDYYRSLFMRYTGTILWEEYHNDSLQQKPDIFVPIEYLVQKGLSFPRNRWDKVIWTPSIISNINHLLEAADALEKP